MWGKAQEAVAWNRLWLDVKNIFYVFFFMQAITNINVFLFFSECSCKRKKIPTATAYILHTNLDLPGPYIKKSVKSPAIF